MKEKFKKQKKTIIMSLIVVASVFLPFLRPLVPVLDQVIPNDSIEKIDSSLAGKFKPKD